MERPPEERHPDEAGAAPLGSPTEGGPQSPVGGPHGEPPTERLPEPAAPPAYGPYPYSPPPPPYAYVQRKTNGFAVASMVLGILWLYWIGSILALIFGMIAKGQIDSSGGTQQGRGMAIAGIVLGWVGVGFLLLFIVFFGGVAGCGALLSS